MASGLGRFPTLMRIGSCRPNPAGQPPADGGAAEAAVDGGWRWRWAADGGCRRWRRVAAVEMEAAAATHLDAAAAHPVSALHREMVTTDGAAAAGEGHGGQATAAATAACPTAASATERRRRRRRNARQRRRQKSRGGRLGF